MRLCPETLYKRKRWDLGSRALFDALHTHNFSFHSLSNLLLSCYNDRIHLIPGRYKGKNRMLDAVIPLMMRRRP
jgi:hypothetical protein